MFSSLKPRHVVLVAAIIAVVLGMVWALDSQESSQRSGHSSVPPSPTDSVRSQPTASAPTEPNPSSTQTAKSQLDSRVKAFVATYFSAAPPEGVTDINQAIKQSVVNGKQAAQPYATAHFMQTASFGYAMYGTQTGSQMLESQASIIATPITGLIDAHISSGKANGTVMVHYVKKDENGTIELGDKPQYLTLVKQGSTWFIDAAPLT